MRGKHRWVRAVPVTVALVVASALVAPGATGAAGRADSGDAASVARELIARRQGAGLVVALLGADAAMSAARSASEDARAAVGRAEAQVTEAAAERTAAEAARGVADAQVAADTRLRAALAVEAYQVVRTGGDATVSPTGSRAAGSDAFARRVAGTTYAQAADGALRNRLAASRSAAEDAAARLDTASATVEEREARVAAARREASAAEAFTVEVTAAAASWTTSRASAPQPAAAPAAAAAPAPGPSNPAVVPGSELSIIGQSLLSAEDLAAAVDAHGGAHRSIDVAALARDFVEEGRAEGVRGDLAFAQAIVETGWFSFAHSMVAPSDNNYAGIGACDSCADGHRFPSPRAGVRAQIQLLRTYAQPGLTTSMLANPPAGRAPEKVYVRGCCSSWGSLSGVWATNPEYSRSIMAVYDRLVVAAAARR